MINKSGFFLVFFWCFSTLIFAQDAPKKALSDLINSLEKQYDVKFSYSDEAIKNIELAAPNKIFSITEVLAFLNKNTPLDFKTLDNRYITVSFLEKKINICGTVLSSENNSPLSLATIEINNTKRGVSTNEKGEFLLKNVSANATVTISFVGYFSKTFIANKLFIKSPCTAISLVEKTEELNEIFIPKFITTGLQKSIDGSTVLNTDKFGILPGLTDPDVLKTIKVLPGVESVNESISNINVRGGTNDQNLMLWDGIKMYHSGHFFGLISGYNPYLTNKVVVTKNGTSSKYSDGVSSTINMTTNNKINSNISGGGGFNLLSADGFVRAPITNKLQLNISGRRSYTDILNTPTYTNYFKRSFQDNSIASNAVNTSTSNFYFYDYSIKLLYDINYNHSIIANLISIKNNLKYDEIYESGDNTIIENSSLQQKNIGIGLTWNADWNTKFSSEFIAFISDYRIDSDDYNKDSDQYQTQLNNVIENSYKLNTKYEFSDVFHFLNGVIFDEIGIVNKTTVNAPTYSKKVKEVLLKSALYSELEYHKNNTYARFGVRANYFHKFNSFLFEPRINIRQKLNSLVSLKFEGEIKNQTTTQKIDFDDNFLGIEKRRWILANNNTVPIVKSKQISLGVAYKTNTLNIDITSFYKKVDGITAANQGFYNNIKTINSIGNYKAKGFEFLINKKIKNISTWISYTFSKNDYNFDVFTPNTFANTLDITHSFSASINYNLSKKLQFSIGGVFRTGKPFTKPIVGNETITDGNREIVNYDSPNKERLDDFYRIDFSGNYKFNLSKKISSSIRFGLTNITDKENIINSYYMVDTNEENNVRRVNSFSLPFTPNLSFRMKF